MPEDLKLHMRRVDDLLAEYENLSGGKLRIEELDPQPDTDAEDSANLDGIRGQSLNDQNLYFGLAISCVDRTSTIPFIDPSQETMLEYQLSRAISEVSRPDKPVIGLMSGLPIAGNQDPMMAMQGQQGSPPWVVYQQLSQSYEVKDLTMTPETIDPSIDVVLVFHPAGITPEAEFAIDQYLLQGGKVVACIDPYSVAAQMAQPANPMMGGGGAPTASTLPNLLGAWGVTMDTRVLADEKYQTTMGGNRPGVAVLTIPQEGMPQKNDVITRDLTSLTFFLPGGLTKSGGGGVSINSLVKSSDKAGFVDSMKASQLDPALATSFRGEKAYDVVMHLKGNFKSAFPKGKPGTEEAAKEEEKKDDKPAEGEAKPGEKKEEKPSHLVEATKEGNVFLISDIDAFFNQFAYRVQNYGPGMQVAQQINGNASLLFNIIDQAAAASTHLIGARSRAAIARPFTKIKELETEANQRVGTKIQEFEKQAEEAQKKLADLQSKKAAGSELYLSPEQEAEIRTLRKQEVDARKEVRELQKDLKRDKDKLAGNAMLANIFIMPLLVILLGIGLFVKRRGATRAR